MKVTSGPNYWLPDVVEQTEYSGWGGGGWVESESSMMDYGLPWREWWWYTVGDGSGTVDLSNLETRLAWNWAAGRTMEIRLMNGGARTSSEAPFANIPADFHSYMSEYQYTTGQGLYQCNVWHPTVASAFNNLITAVGAAYADDERVESVTIHGLSDSTGEEFVWEPSLLQAMADEWSGGDIDSLRTDIEDWLMTRMDVYAAAFAGYEHKVVWVGHHGDKWDIYMPESWQQMNLDLIDYALNLGFGVRGGIHTKNLTINFQNPTLGLSIDSDGYQYVDETLPQFDGRYHGEENEFVWGDDPSDLERHRLQIMRALQLRVNHVYSHYANIYPLNTEFWEYARLSFGKTAATSADAWACLWEQDISSSSLWPNTTKVRNYERWLIQRDLPGGTTTATEFHASTSGGGGFGWEVAPYGFYTARRTDLDGGNRRIFFKADFEYRIDIPVRVHVEIYDKDLTTFAIEYNDGSGVVSTPGYTSSGDKTVKTVAWDINGMDAGGLDNGQDFAINLGILATADVVVRMVRVVQITPGSEASIYSENVSLSTSFDKTGSASSSLTKSASLSATLREES